MISIIMPVYNGIEWLQEAINSILYQSYTDFEFIIIDDFSSEPVMDLIASCFDTRIIALRNKENIGLTKSLNIGLDIARGDFIARMDGDDIAHPDRFKKQLKLFTEGIGLVSCWGQSIDVKGNFVVDFVDVHCRIFNEDLKTKFLKLNCVLCPTSIYSRAAVEKIGYFDPSMYLGQTYNYNLRVLKYFEGRVVPEILYTRRLWPSQVGKRIRRASDEAHRISWGALAHQQVEDNLIIKNRIKEQWES